MKKDIVDVENLNFSYNDEENIFDNVSFSIPRGELIAIIGPNGSGKTTLVKMIAGLVRPGNGKIKVNGKLSYIPQKYSMDTNFPAKVSELLDLECCECSIRDEVIRTLEIDKLLDKQFKNLSGGQQQKVMLTISLLSEPDIIILDEPVVGVDIHSQKRFYELLKNLNKKRGLTILFVTHDTGMISNYFSKILCIHDGSVIIEDAKKTSEVLKKAYGTDFNEVHHHHH